MIIKLCSYVGLDNSSLISKGKNYMLFTFSVNKNKQKSKQFVYLFILAIKNKIIKFPFGCWYLRHLCSFWEISMVLCCTNKLQC